MAERFRSGKDGKLLDSCGCLRLHHQALFFGWWGFNHSRILLVMSKRYLVI